MSAPVIKIEAPGIARLEGEAGSINSVDQIKELMREVKTAHQSVKVLLRREMIDEGKFDLRSGFVKELSQLFTQLDMRLAMVGEFNLLERVALKAYAQQTGLGKTVYITKTEQDALRWLRSV
ncbi:MAG: DUF4180 domain-containing protein [Christensenellales bacterium]|jgi:hypothetical protein|nr:DUF4180 domain-containing protein [Clostridiales bacterium]